MNSQNTTARKSFVSMYLRKVSRSTSSMLSSFFCVRIHWKTSCSSPRSPWYWKGNKKCNIRIRHANVWRMLRLQVIINIPAHRACRANATTLSKESSLLRLWCDRVQTIKALTFQKNFYWNEIYFVWCVFMRNKISSMSEWGELIILN